LPKTLSKSKEEILEEKTEDGRKGVKVTDENWTANAVYNFAFDNELIFREGTHRWINLQLPGESKLSQRSVATLDPQESTFRNARKRRHLDEEARQARLRQKAREEAKEKANAEAKS